MIDNPMNRVSVKRGSQLPQAKLNESDVELIRELVADRERIKEQLKHMTNQAIADKFGVHVRTIDRISAGFGWGHVA